MGTEKVQHEYGADEIQILEGLEAVLLVFFRYLPVLDMEHFVY